jgi:catalase
MNPLTVIKNWLTKRLSPTKPAIQQLEELVMRTAMAGHSKLKPKYYTRPHGQFADFEDFDTDRMIEDLSEEFPAIPKDEVRRVVMHGIYYYYLR